MLANHHEQAAAILAAAQKQLEALGLKCIHSPTSLPQGYTLALIVGDSDLATAAAHVALSVGGSTAHTSASRTKFDHQVSELLTDFAVIKAAR